MRKKIKFPFKIKKQILNRNSKKDSRKSVLNQTHIVGQVKPKKTDWGSQKNSPEGFGAVSLPNALDSKYPSGNMELKWQWHFPPFLCNSPARIRLQHPRHTGTSRSQRCEHHHDLYPCSKPRNWRRGKSARQNVDFYKYPCKICTNSQKMIYNKKISKNCKDFTMDTEKLC